MLENVLPLALLPLYTRYLTASDLGVVATVMGVVKFLVLFYALGGTSSMLRHSFPEKGEPQQHERFWGTLLVFLLCVGGIASIVLTLSSEWIITTLARDVPFWPILALGLAIAFFSPIRRYFLISLQARELGSSYALHAGGALLLRLPLVVICLHYFGWKAEGVLFSILASEMIFAILGLIGLHHVVRWGLDTSVLGTSLSYSLPLLPHALAGWVATYLGAIILNFSVGAAEAGIFNIANQFNIGLALLGMAYIRALTPMVFRALSGEGNGCLETAAHKVLAGVAGLGVVCMLFSLFAPEIAQNILGDDFAMVGIFIPVFTTSAFLYILHSFYATVLLYKRRGTWWLLASSLCAMALTVAMMFWLIPAYGIIGATLAGAAGVVLRLILLAVLCNTKFRVFWSQSWFWALSSLVIVASLTPLIGSEGLARLGTLELGARVVIFAGAAFACSITARHFLLKIQ